MRPTRYSYEKRIKELEQELGRTRDRLFFYRESVHEIYSGITQMLEKGDCSAINMGWVLNKMKRCLK